MNSLNEKKVSANGKNAYVIVSGENEKKVNIYDPAYNRNYLTAKSAERARSCSPAVEANENNNINTPTIKLKNSVENNSKENMKNNATKTTLPSKSNTQACDNPVTTCSGTLNVINTEKNASVNDAKSKGAIPKEKKISNEKSPALPGMLRYISINKRNLSPQKNTAPFKKQKIDDPLRSNRFALLSEKENQQEQDGKSEQKPSKPPPIYLREPSSNNLVSKLIELIGKNNFHIIPIRKGGLQETKIVLYTEDCYRKISQYLNDSKKNFYTYQLKSSKGLIVVIKGIEPSVEPKEIKEALKEMGYQSRAVVNIFNREKIPQPMFRVELEPDQIKLKRSETHPIYSLRYLLNRRINVEEPLKRSRPVQCGNCQEFGHTKNYCTLRTVCVACGDLHSSSQCDIIKNGLGRKCGNCGGDHSANYRGCPVYKELLKRLKQRQRPMRSEVVKPTFVNTACTFNPVNSGASPERQNVPLAQTYAQTLQTKPKASSYANILKTGNQQQPNNSPNLGGFENLIQALTQNITSLNQNMTTFMSSMQNTIQELLRAQNQIIQILLSEK